MNVSNPGVLCLASQTLISGQVLKVEDNIGEAIHVHYGEVRIDFTIPEFLAVADALVQAVNMLIEIPGFDINMFDPLFMADISRFLVDLERIQYSTIHLDDIRVQTQGLLGLPIVRRLHDSRVVRALKGDSRELAQYRQDNMIHQSNVERLEKIRDSIRLNGYPYAGQYMVFFNNQNNVRDGQHRASCLYQESGNIEVPIVRLHFRSKKYGVTQYPALLALPVVIRRTIRRVTAHFYAVLKRKLLRGFERA